MNKATAKQYYSTWGNPYHDKESTVTYCHFCFHPKLPDNQCFSIPCRLRRDELGGRSRAKSEEAKLLQKQSR